MPKGNSGIQRGGGGGGKLAFFDKKKYEAPVTYKSTSSYKSEMVKDPNGKYTHAETHEKYSIVETYAENPGFREIRRAPVGSIVVVHQPALEFRLRGKIPAHDEYYEVVQRTSTIKAVKFRHTTSKTGHYYWRDQAQTMSRPGDGMGGDINSLKEIKVRFPFAERITIYRPKVNA